MKHRPDMDTVGDGSQEYNARTHDYISHHAERLRITFDEAAEIYERSRYAGRDGLADRPTPEPEPGEFCDVCGASLFADEVAANPRWDQELCHACAKGYADANPGGG